MPAEISSPWLLELNTRCWLRELPEHRGRARALASVPESCIAGWAETGLSHVWLMGVWTTGPRSQARAVALPALRAEYDRALPDWRDEDVAGSPYAVAGHAVPEALGGVSGLRSFRRRLHDHGLKLILDFVPNHVGLDHPWIEAHPDYFVQASPDHPLAFRRETRHGLRWIAHGRDPYFPPWDDTAQLDYRSPGLRRAMVDELLHIAGLCDGVRCDMAMLVLPEVFERTWRDFPVAESGSAMDDPGFWPDAIAAVKAAHPDFLFLAEAYWGMEARLQAEGFDFTYDKQLTDALLTGQGAEAADHLRSRPAAYIHHSAHFLENHDEQRVAAVLAPEAHRAAALLTLALPGLRFLHEGQTEGATVRTPVQLVRRRIEPVDTTIQAMYIRLFAALGDAGVGQGEACVLRPRPAWPGNPSWEGMVVIQWGSADSPHALVVVNLSAHRAQCRVSLRALPSRPAAWQLVDLLGEERWTRATPELQRAGLYLDVGPHAAQLFVLRPGAVSPRGVEVRTPG